MLQYKRSNYENIFILHYVFIKDWRTKGNIFVFWHALLRDPVKSVFPSLTATFPVSGHPYLKSAGGGWRGAVRGRAVGSVRYIFKPGCGCFKKIHLQWPPSRSPNKDCQSIKNISDSPFPPPRHGVAVRGGGAMAGGRGLFFSRVSLSEAPGPVVNNVYE